MSADQPTPSFPPGQPALRHSLGNYESFLAELLTATPLAQLPDGPFAGTRPLASMDLSAGAGFGRAYLEAWARVSDVLSFYQERLMNEGYLRTAVQASSVRLLLASLDYAPFPAVSSEVLLAFTVVDPSDGSPVTIPPGTAVQSVPSGAAGLPLTFETSEPVRARAAWNALAAYVPPPGQPPYVPVPPPPAPSGPAGQVVLQGVNLGLKRGDRLLIRSGALPDAWFLAQIAAVDARPKQSLTRLTWTVEAGSVGPGEKLSQPEAYALRATTGLFGATATDWTRLSLDAKLQAGATPKGGARRATAGVGEIPWRPRKPDEDWTSAQRGLSTNACFACGVGAAVFVGSLDRGLFVSRDGARTWSSAGVGIGNKPVLCLAHHPEVGLVVGSTAGGVFRSTDGASTWQRISGGSVQLKEIPGRATKAPPGSATGAPSSSPTPSYRAQITRLPLSAVRSLAIVDTPLDPNGGRVPTLWAGTDAGVYVSEDLGATWAPMSDGLPTAGSGGSSPTDDTRTASVSVKAFALQPVELGGLRLFAGTSGGLYSCAVPNLHARPQWAPAGPPGLAVNALLCTGDGTVLAGTSGGIWVYPPTADAPTGTPRLVGRAVRALASIDIAQDGEDEASPRIERVFAATDVGLYYSDELDRDPWHAIPVPHTTELVAVATASPDVLLCAGPLEGVIESEWPGFHIPEPVSGQATIDLDRVVTTVQPYGWAVLLPGTPPPPPGITATVPPRPAPKLVTPPSANSYSVAQTTTAAPMRFGLLGSVTRLTVTGSTDALGDLHLYDLRSTLALVASERLSLSSTTLALSAASASRAGPTSPFCATFGASALVFGDTLDLVAGAAGLEAGRTLLVGGRPIRLLVDGSWANVTGARVLASGVTVVVCEGDGGRLTSQRDVEPDAVFAAQDPSGPLTYEAVSVAGLELLADRVRVRLAPPGLMGVYDAASVVAYGNVALASEGQTHPTSNAGNQLPGSGEVLGSGDRSKRFQQFAPAFQPLSYVRDPVTGEIGPALRVRVDDVEWSETPALPLAGPDDRVYAVRPGASSITIEFGDGRHGARLPSGVNNVTATYRAGSGAAGNAPAGAIKILPGAGVTLSQVVNPLPAQGGVDPQPLAVARSAGPIRSRPLGRVVSIADLVDFVQTYPGVGKAATFEVATPRGKLRVLTIAGDDQRPLPPGAPLRELMTRAIAAASAPDSDLAQGVQLATYTPRTFVVGARLTLAPGAAEQPTLASAAQALRARFSFERRQFAQPVTAAEVVTALQEVRGVVAVRLTALALTRVLSGEQPASVLPAAAPSWTEGALRSAELLLLGPDEASVRLVAGAV